MTSPSEPPRGEPLDRPLRCLLVVAASTTLLARLPASGLPFAAELMQLGIAATLLLGALRCAETLGGARAAGFDMAGLLEAPEGERGLLETLHRALPSAWHEVRFTVQVALWVFPPFVLGFAWWHGPHHPLRWNPPNDLFQFAMAQVLVVAIPEEAFFRGYLQSALARRWPERISVLGTPVPWRALLLQAAAFGLMHFLTEPNPQRLAVAFPALLFGWMKERRGGIGSSVLFHALSNVVAELLVRGWLR